MAIPPYPRPVLALKNIGLSLARKLKAVGIATELELRQLGAVGAFRQLRKRYPSTSLSLWQCLFSLEGALRDVAWHHLSQDRMRELLRTLADDRRDFSWTPLNNRKTP